MPSYHSVFNKAEIHQKYCGIPVFEFKEKKTPTLDATKLKVDLKQMELDIMGKVFCLKEQQWSEEREWRKVMTLNDNANIHYHNGKPYVEFYLDKKYLTGITVFCTPDTKDNAQKGVEDIRNYIHDRGYKADVKVEVFSGKR